MAIPPLEGPRTAEVQTGTPAPAPARTEKQSWLGRLFSRLMGTRRQAANAETTESVSRNPFSRLKSSGSRFNFRGSRQVPPRQSLPQMQSKDGEISVDVKKSLLSRINSSRDLTAKLQNDPPTRTAFKEWGDRNPDTKENSAFIFKIMDCLIPGDTVSKPTIPSGEFSEKTQGLIDKGKLKVDRGNRDEIIEIATKLKKLDISVLKKIFEEHIDMNSPIQVNVSGSMYNLAKDAYNSSSAQELAEGIALCFVEVAGMTAGNLKNSSFK